MISGSQPDSAYATILPRGFNDLDLAVAKFINTTAAAPSFIPDALPAVTLPPCRKLLHLLSQQRQLQQK